MPFRAVLENFSTKSMEQLELLRKTAANEFGDRNDLIIGVNGSLARGELTSGSDVDFFFLTASGDIESAKASQASYRAALEKVGIKMPATGGVFEIPLPTTDLVKNIGGSNDTNDFITRRMLFLLEGQWLTNRAAFEKIRDELITRYVEDNLDDHKICLFFMNDVIRYWRTICVDYEHKVLEGNKPKAIRLIKLRFSRMMLYFGGIVAVEGTECLPYLKKREALAGKLARTPIQRIQNRFGSGADAALSIYAEFLTQIDTKRIRDALELPGETGLNTKEFETLSEMARQFKEELAKLLLQEFGTTNPVVKALLL